jgi:hypothetical protein
MARVFISYRRKDGQYAVGWIEERLRQIGGGTPVGTAFRDSDLKYGDDFPARLAREVDACDVLIAVIGPQWHGHEDGRPDRILDPADWVGREITSALDDPDKLIIPVLLSGVEPLRADDLLPEHRAFADLHALRFDDRSDLEQLAEQVAAHVAQIDAERARRDGLDTPIAPRRWRPTSATILLALASSVLMAGLGWVSSQAVDDATWWKVLCSVQAAYWAGAFVWGVAYLRHVLLASLDVDWRVVARAAAVAVVLIALTVTSVAPRVLDTMVFTLFQALAAVMLLSPWIMATVGPGWSRREETSIRVRTLHIAEQRRGMNVGIAVIAVALALSVAASAEVVTDAQTETSDVLSIFGFGVFLTIVLLGGLEFAHSRLRHASELVVLETTDLGHEARDHVLAALVVDRRDFFPWTVTWSAVPTIAATIAGVIAAVVGGTP